MPKPNPLTQGLSRNTANRTSPGISTDNAPARAPRTATAATRSRDGRVLVAGHFAPNVQIELKVIAAQERTTVQALLEEAINTVFAKRGKPEIASITS